ncbi:MAG TPA: RidA family protein [Candidatus Saccharimonadales bacterium]|nr:RidA family protein [Candidatus Saccharimonadales bacterium]
MMLVEAKLKELGIVLPEPLKPLGVYVPAVKVDDWVYVSGMVALQNGEYKYKGKVGRDLTLEQGYESARICGINALAALKSVIGDLGRVQRIVKVVGYVNSTDDFTKHPQVVNGASELFEKIFGEKGIAARCAVGVQGLPGDSPAEIDMVVKIN